MLLKRIEIDNYKSLRGVVMEPTPLSALVGPNAAGKTNFCEALDFLAHVYQWGLEEAVAYKGGFENICFRNSRGLSKEPIRFRVVLKLATYREKFLVDHAFEFGSRKEPSALFSVVSEDVTVSLLGKKPIQELRLSRRGRRAEVKVSDSSSIRILGDTLKEILDEKSAESERGLLLSVLQQLLVGWGRPLKRRMEAVRVFQINAHDSRSSGVPTPAPSLERFGANLPAVILHLKKEHPDEYRQILESLKSVLPDVEDLDVDFTHTRTLALFVRQRGQAWPAEDLSDGTIQALALLTAVFDPRTSLLILEEPENNVHPWAIRSFAEAFRTASVTKQILLTTHSPILVDQLKPEELWIVRRPGTTAEIDPVLTLDPSLKRSWKQGRFTLSEYLDSGALPEAVPAAS